MNWSWKKKPKLQEILPISPGDTKVTTPLETYIDPVTITDEDIGYTVGSGMIPFLNISNSMIDPRQNQDFILHICQFCGAKLNLVKLNGKCPNCGAPTI